MIDQAGYINFPQRPKPPLSNGLIGMMLLVGTETILFTCFIGAYLVLRMGASVWPPLGTPSLSIALPAINTTLLLVSALSAFVYRRAMSAENFPRVRIFLSTTLGLGILFLVLQGVEFQHLYALGLTLQTGPYGAVFFSLITCHGLHVLGGLIFLAVLLAQMGGTLSSTRTVKIREWIGYSELYWYFVTAVWLVLFGILYLA